MLKSKKQILPKQIFPIITGQALESYDFFLYGLLSIYFAKIFFPPSDNSLVFAFLLFSVAYLATPLGSVIWGHIADKYGRKCVLIGTVSFMAIPAIGMAVMPSYETMGITVCFLVLILRFLQGVAFGGECPTIVVTLYESAPKEKKGFYGSFYNPGALLGYFIGVVLMIILTSIMGDQNMQSFGWRFMFGFSLLFIIALSYIRLKLIETSAINTKTLGIPIVTTIKNDCAAVIKIFLYFSCCTIMFWNLLFHNYLIIWANDFGIQGLTLQAFLVAFVIIFMPCIGYVSDKINKIKLLKFTYFCIIFSAPFLYTMFLTKNIVFMILGYFILAVFTSITCGTFPSVVVPQVSKNCRVSSIGIACSFSVIIGSFVPAINEFIKNATEFPASPAWLISIGALISLITLYTFKNKDI